MRDDEWKAVEGATTADKAAMRFFRDAVMGYVHYRDNGDIAPGTLDLWIVAKGGGAELCHIDWFAFSR